MKVFIYVGSHDNNCIEAAYSQVELGNDVFIVHCDKSMALCRMNHLSCELLCKYCEFQNKRLWVNDIKKKGASVHAISEFRPDEPIDFPNLKFEDINELKQIKYKDIEIGFGAFSTYVTITRNVMPIVNDAFKEYITEYMKSEIIAIESLEKALDQFEPELVILHNGRFAEYKPILGLAKTRGINYITTEEVYHSGKVLKNDFYNDVVHSITANYRKYQSNWEKSPHTNEEKLSIAKSFYENRRNKKAAGDKIYTKDQESGLLPAGFDKSKEIITIFNSSEDEFCAISSEYDGYKLFENQFKALTEIFDHYKDDRTKHFYVRIHPNLKSVPYRSHTALYNLNYDNATIIPADSPVDSYVLMDNSDKIIVFDSTMAVESAYWGKPVIELSKYMWSLMGVTYTPESNDELWNLIDSKELKCKKSDDILKYAYWVMNPNYEEENLFNYRTIDFSFLGHKIFVQNEFYSLAGSYKLNSLIKFLLVNPKVASIIPGLTRFKRIPCE